MKIGQLSISPFTCHHILWITHEIYHDTLSCWHYEMVEEFLPQPFSNVHLCVIICFITRCTSPNISMRQIWLEKMIRKSRQIIKQKYQDIPYNRRVYNLTNKAKAFVVSSCCLTTTYWLLYITLFHVRKYFKLPFSSFLSIWTT